MNRLQKKCVIVSAGFHLSLALLLVVGPAFLTSREEPEAPVFKLVDIPSILTEGPAGGGSPDARQLPQAPKPAQQTPAPAPVQPQAPAPVAPPQPAKPAVSEPEPEPAKVQTPASTEVAAPRKPRMPDVSGTTIVRKAPRAPKASDSGDEPSAAEQRNAARRKAAGHALAMAADTVANGTSGATTIKVGDHGSGGGGPSYGSYDSLVWYTYDRYWTPPEDASVERGVTTASVTIARDGTVTSTRILKRSGDSRIDDSVLRTLERVRTMPKPFPESMKGSERTYTIEFDLSAKRGNA